MNTQEILKRAERYLKKLNVDFVSPGEIGKVTDHKVEVIFLVPDALDPNCVIDPPDVRVWVNLYNDEITWIDLM